MEERKRRFVSPSDCKLMEVFHEKQSFPARGKLRTRLLAIVPAYTAAGLTIMPLLEYILPKSADRISEWLYLRLDVLYFFYLVIGLSVIFYHYWRKPWDYLDEVINAAQTVYEQNNAAIEPVRTAPGSGKADEPD